MMLKISVCLTDIPKERIKRSKDGKKAYAEFLIGSLKEKDKYGNEFFVALSNSKEEREAKVETIFVGNGKEIGKKTTQPSATAAAAQATEVVEGDLPW